MINQKEAQKISNLIYYIDYLCRKDLSNNTISNERDYISNFTTHIRFPLGIFSVHNVLTAFTLSHSIEQKFGCDAIVIFKKNDDVKVGMFEAKLPREFLAKGKKQWDNKLYKSKKFPNYSRFSCQLVRQHKWSKIGIVIWEMFLNEKPPGHPFHGFDLFGSSCIMHDKVYKYLVSHNKHYNRWTDIDLNNILNKSRSIKNIIQLILTCKIGKSFQILNNSVKIITEKKQQLMIPIFNNEGNNSNEEITHFMVESGLKFYFFIDFNLFD